MSDLTQQYDGRLYTQPEVDRLIAKAKEQERNKIIEYVQVNQKGQFEEDSTGTICWYLDDLVRTLKEHKDNTSLILPLSAIEAERTS